MTRRDLSAGRRVRAGRPRFPTRSSLTPAELFIGSFLLLTVIGTLGFKFLPGLYRDEPLSWNDALFTATSAVCVTGLIVVDTESHFTFVGQAYVLLLIQLGGLGMLTLTSVIITTLGGRPTIRSEQATSGIQLTHVSSRQLIADVVRFTFFIEALGAVILYVLWLPGLGWRDAVWPAIFHSVSAFCNAGFSTNSDSLMGFHSSPATILTISALVIAGGIGFVTLEELVQRFSASKVRRLSVHTRLVIATTCVLLAIGWFLFAVLEWHGCLDGMSLIDKVCNAFFMSVTARTAGFNTIDYAMASDSSNFLTMVLMMIGGSPGSTAGGMKTTTVALIALLAWSRLRSHRTTTFGERSIPADTIQRAVGLFAIATGLVVIGILFATSIDNYLGVRGQFLSRAFEVVSAFNTVGLSMGITADLPIGSRWVLILLMFVGRTGPLAIASALVLRLSQRGEFRLAYEDVNVG